MLDLRTDLRTHYCWILVTDSSGELWLKKIREERSHQLKSGVLVGEEGARKISPCKNSVSVGFSDPEVVSSFSHWKGLNFLPFYTQKIWTATCLGEPRQLRFYWMRRQKYRDKMYKGTIPASRSRQALNGAAIALLQWLYFTTYYVHWCFMMYIHGLTNPRSQEAGQGV